MGGAARLQRATSDREPAWGSAPGFEARRRCRRPMTRSHAAGPCWWGESPIILSLALTDAMNRSQAVGPCWRWKSPFTLRRVLARDATRLREAGTMNVAQRHREPPAIFGSSVGDDHNRESLRPSRAAQLLSLTVPATIHRANGAAFRSLGRSPRSAQPHPRAPTARRSIRAPGPPRRTPAERTAHPAHRRPSPAARRRAAAGR